MEGTHGTNGRGTGYLVSNLVECNDNFRSTNQGIRRSLLAEMLRQRLSKPKSIFGL